MSFLPDLAGWALSGGAGRNYNNDENPNDDNDEQDEPMQQESEEEIRAKRIARLTARSSSTAESGDASVRETEKKKQENMNVDDDNVGSTSMEIDKPEEMVVVTNDEVSGDMKPVATGVTACDSICLKEMASDKIDEPLTKKKRDETSNNTSSPTKLDPTAKLHRKREMLLKKVLNIKLTGSNIVSPGCIEIDIGSAVATEENIAEILALRLDMSPSYLNSASPLDKNLIAYLANCHKKASEELQSTKSTNNTKNDEHFLQEIKNQVVSFAASSLLAPDLFTLGKDGIGQLTECLSRSSLDPSSSITMGLSGKKSSFYACLCEELYNQDKAVFESVIQGIVSNISESLGKCETILDTTYGSGLEHVSALTSVCSHKKAAAVVTTVQNFLLPKHDSPQAREKNSDPFFSPPPPPGATPQQQTMYRMMQAMTHGQGFLGRSGPALEKKTLLGQVMRLGTPMDNSSITSQFQNVASRSRSDVKKNTENLRRQLKGYQESILSFVKALITAGEEARKPVCYHF